MLAYQPKTDSLIKKIWRKKFIYLLLLPGVVWYLIFCYGPMYGLILAFKDFNYSLGIIGSPWAPNYGLEYFYKLFRMPTFWNVTSNTVIISFFKLIIGFPAPIILSILINELISKRFKKFVQTAVYLPYFLSWVIIAGIMFNLLSVNGLVNQIRIQVFSLNPIQFLTTPEYFRPILYLSDLWKEVGWGIIIYSAAIAGINTDMYEAALIDGANIWKKTIYITLPAILPTIMILLLLKVGSMLIIGFDQVLNLYNPAVYGVGDIIHTYVYRKGIYDSEFSFATAAGLFISAINFVLLVVTNKIIKKVSGQSIY